MPRVMCVWFPRWPIQRLRIERPELSRAELVLFAAGSRRPLVSACSPAAESQGVRVGQPLAEARSLRPRAVFLPDDAQADTEALRRLALDGQSFSPLVGLEESPRPSAMLAIADGCTHLHGGEGPFLEEVHRYWVGRGYFVRLAMAGSVGAAWALARVGKMTLVPPGEEAQALAALPVLLLRLPDDVVEKLHSLGLSTIGSVIDLPRPMLAGRFGVILPTRLDQALAVRDESFVCERLKEPIAAGREWESPIEDRHDLLTICHRLLRELLAEADRRGVGVQELEGVLRTEAGPVTIAIGMSRPTSDERHVIQLVELHLERRTWPGGVVGVRWAAVRVGRVGASQGSWLDDDPDRSDTRAFHAMVDRLASRLEPDAVLRFDWIADPQPEHAVRLSPWTGPAPASDPAPGDPAAETSRSRPLRLLRNPQPIEVTAIAAHGAPVQMTWRGEDRRVVRAWGPERIATGWWRSRDVQRDYYRVEWEQGTQVWVYREPRTGRWFLHGFFD